MAFPSLRRLDPGSPRANTERRAFVRALRLFHEAARRVPAYKAFLKSAGVDPATVRTRMDYALVPETDKANYFSRYSLDELSWDGTLKKAKYVSTSSGSTGAPFFWPRGEEQDVITGLVKQRVYRDIFGARDGTTLFVNSFSLGTWIAGMEFLNGARWVAERGNSITTVSPGIDKEEAVRQIAKLSPLFSRVILAGYPPFVKDIIEHGRASGIAWENVDLRLFFAGEAVIEPWRDRLLTLMGRPGECWRTVVLYGMAETGVVAHETPVSQLIRRNLETFSASGVSLPDPNEVMGLYQYYPLARYFEVAGKDSLVLTANAGLPLIRYSTRDNGGILDYAETLRGLGQQLVDKAAATKTDLRAWQMPFVYLHGRKDLSLSLYAVNIYPENVKAALENSPRAALLSGFFTMKVDHGENLDQRFTIMVELASDIDPSVEMERALSEEIVATLQSTNSEYAKLLSAVGERARPAIVLVRHGELGATPGRKHRWVKHS